MSYADSTGSAIEHLDAMASLHPDLSERYENIASLLSHKLYHQLTMAVLDFMDASFSSLRTTAEGANSYLALYDKVVLAVEKKLNPLSLARIASLVANSFLLHIDSAVVPASSCQDAVAARAVLENLVTKKDLLGTSALIFAESKLGLLNLGLLERGTAQDDSQSVAATLADIKSMLANNKLILSELGNRNDSTRDAEAIVHSAHYECAMTYRKAVGPPEAYYREAIQYLNYTPLDSLSPSKQYALATDLSLAALTAEGVYNIGEVVQNNAGILSVLEQTDNEWLVKLMHAAAHGDVAELDNISNLYAASIQKQPALVSRAPMVKEKITLLALVNMVFERPSSERTLKFDDIAIRTGLVNPSSTNAGESGGNMNDVELLIIRALSLGLIRGSMDQVEGTVDVTWVMSRVLNEEQLIGLSKRFEEWALKVSQTRDYVGESVPTFG